MVLAIRGEEQKKEYHPLFHHQNLHSGSAMPPEVGFSFFARLDLVVLYFELLSFMAKKRGFLKKSIPPLLID